MTIEIITEKEYNLLKDIQKEFPCLTYISSIDIPYNYPSKKEEESVRTVEIILKSCIKGYVHFKNFAYDSKKKVALRFVYNWGVDDDDLLYYEGVGYIYIDELRYGFF